MQLHVAVMGGGSWGTTVASMVSRNTPTVLWARDANVVVAINQRHENPPYLPGIALEPGIAATTDPAAAIAGAPFLQAPT